MTENKGKIVFIPMPSQGHINYCVTIANRFLELYGDKNDVYFILNQDYTNKVQKQVPNAKYLVYPDNDKDGKPKDNNSLIESMNQFARTWTDNRIEHIKQQAPLLKLFFDGIKSQCPTISKLIEEIKPDFIIFDQLFSIPVGIDKGIPYANLLSAAVNFSCLDGMPPPQGGLSSIRTPENEKLWEQFINDSYRTPEFKVLRDEVNQFLKDSGVPDLGDHYFMFKNSPHMNIYAYPEELDYDKEIYEKAPGKWLRIESPISCSKPFVEKFPIPENLQNLPGKLIYFSLGSMASAYIPLMIKVVNILGQLPHRFIISKGLAGDLYKLKDNMYGEKYLNQFAVLNTVDIVISHGGNNTMTEAFYFGKPIIFLPLFGDQSDNAQRAADKDLGVRLSIFDKDEKFKKDLEDAIDFCSQEAVVEKMKKASERIKKDPGLDIVCKELLAYTKK